MRPEFNVKTISDNHYNHFKISEYCGRGFKSEDEMNEAMFEKWNDNVKPNDVVISLGDIVFTKGESYKIKEIFSKLNGRLILVKGNHDRKSHRYYLANGVDFICDRFIWYYNHKKILFIHNPRQATYNDYRTCDFIIHGHRHNKGKFISKKNKAILINVSVEKINYTPIDLNKLLMKATNLIGE